MPIYSAKNLYPGVNPHLNSALQAGRGWGQFHSRHINDIVTALDNVLPPNYYVLSEQSLQISEVGLDKLRDKRTTPDIAVIQAREAAPQPSPVAAAEPTITLLMDELLGDEDDFLTAALIYEFNTSENPGKFVTRIEVLSPANKPPHGYARDYQIVRSNTLQAGVNLIEVDYLHTLRPVIRGIRSYTDNENGAFPYTIAVSFPKHDSHQFRVDIYGIGVDEPLPKINIPLAHGDIVPLDFNAIYHQTYAESRANWMFTDYTAEPAQFDRYQPQDRQRIRARMAAIAAEHGTQGDDVSAT